jgi:raffinose/stachyose/melibiose transport system permease protein
MDTGSVKTTEYANTIMTSKEGGRALNKRFLRDSAVFLLPTVLVITIVMVIPFVIGIYLSLTKWNGVSSKMDFVAFSNFVELFAKGKFYRSLWFTVRITTVVVVLVNAMGILIAELLTRGLRGSNFFRAGYYLPNTMGGIVVGFIWQFVFIQGFPAIGAALRIGFLQQQWLGTEATAFWGLVMVTCWQSIGFVMIVMIAALCSVPGDLVEAAVIDGAGYWRTFLQIKLPYCRPYISTCLFWTISLTFKMFDLNVSLTSGGPFGSTTSMSQLIYQDAFSNNRYGYATAEALVFFVILFVITSIQNFAVSRREG